MRGGSLFSGIGGFELGAALAGVDVDWRWQVEQDEFCRRILAKHWPDADRSVTDVKEAGRNNLAPVDVIVGGFPCQDISLAGKGAGLAGERSGLWREFARIIGELLPRVVIVENVSAIISRGLDTVCGDLAAFGYDAEWATLRASDVGAPHRRERLFIVAWRISDADRFRLRIEPGRRKDGRKGSGSPESRNVGAQLAYANSTQRQRDRRTFGAPTQHSNASGGGEWPPGPDDMHAWRRVPKASQPSICRVAHGVPRGMDRNRLKALGNAIVPQCAAIAWRRAGEVFYV